MVILMVVIMLSCDDSGFKGEVQAYITFSVQCSASLRKNAHCTGGCKVSAFKGFSGRENQAPPPMSTQDSFIFRLN